MIPPERVSRTIVIAALGSALIDVAVNHWLRDSPSGPGFFPAAVVTMVASYSGATVWRGRWTPVAAALAAVALYATLAWAGMWLLHRAVGDARPWLPWERPGRVAFVAVLLAALAVGMAYSGRDDAARARTGAS